MTKAIALLSGGLDSTLALRLILDQGIEIEALNFVTPFCNCNHGGEGCAARRAADEVGVSCTTVAAIDEFFDVIREPRYGYGSGMNPCLDCRILMFTRARERMEQVGAAFCFTGEVLGQRPMSQHRRAMNVIARDSGLDGRLLRPLSARLLPPTIPEKEGLVDRDRLLALHGRSRKPQIALAGDRGIADYPCPAGGCLLTDPAFARRMRNLVDTHPDFGLNDVNLLKVGRHFRLSLDARLVVGRDEAENHRLPSLARPGDLLFEVRDCGSPITLLRGGTGEPEIYLAAAATARYSDARGTRVEVNYGAAHAALDRVVVAAPMDEEQLDRLRV